LAGRQQWSAYPETQKVTLSAIANFQEESPVVICVAPNGARRSRKDHERIPLTPEELAREAVSCVEAGASVMHLHVRASDGGHSLDPAIYRSALAAIRAAVGQQLILQVTTESAGRYAPPEQMAVIRELKPEAASVALRELIPDEAGERAAADFFQFVVGENIGLQFILYTPTEVARLMELRERGVIPPARHHALFVLGNYRDRVPSAPRSLLPFLWEWPTEWPWTVCAFGRSEAQCLAAAVSFGGHVRVGFENNLCNPDGTLAASNAALIENISQIIDRTGRKRADVSQARTLYMPARG